MKITIRADSGFCRWRLMRWCDRNGVGYVLGLARNPALERAGAGRGSRGPSGSSGATGAAAAALRLVRLRGGELGPAAAGDRQGRAHGAGANPRFVVTNVPGDPQELYEEVYCQRGEMENRIKEQQLDLFADRTSCHRFLANQFRLLLSSAAYVLVQALRRTALAGTELARAQVGTIRLKLLKVAARVRVRSAGWCCAWPAATRCRVVRQGPPPATEDKPDLRRHRSGRRLAAEKLGVSDLCGSGGKGGGLPAEAFFPDAGHGIIDARHLQASLPLLDHTMKYPG